MFLLYESNIIRVGYEIIQKEDILKDRSTFENFLCRLETQERKGGQEPSALFTQPSNFFDRLYEKFCEHHDFSEFCRELFSANIPPDGIWGNKLVDREELNILLQLFPDARFVIVIRDVRSVAYSNYEFFGTDYFISALTWADTARIIKSIQARNCDRVMVLRYEDFVSDARQTLKQIASLIGRESPEDFSTADRASTNSTDKWRNHLASREARQIEEVCFDEMQHFGYTPELALGPRKVSQLRLLFSVAHHIQGRLTKRRGGLKGLLSYKSLLRYLKLYQKIAPSNDY